MKKISKVIYSISSLLLAVVMLVGVFSVFPLKTEAATVTKDEKSYEIAVVYDNSGSMYAMYGSNGSIVGHEAWSRAKYAMEIFASMLNYDNGDKLRIFPMWEVTTDGSTPSSGGSYKPIEIDSVKDINKISNMYTVNPNETPLEPVFDAKKYLESSKADEKWLLILTDGAFTQMNRGQGYSVSGDELEKHLLDVTTDEIKVQYLGFDGATKLKTNKSENFFATNSTDTSLKDDLIKICNSIFQRSVLPSNRLKGDNLNLDLSMKKLIVFVQGSNAKINSLTDKSGNKVKSTLDSGQRKYSEISAYGFENAPTDKSLAGQVVTFAGCPKGEYTLDCSGVDKGSIQIFYEPDVDIKVTLTNSDGKVIDGNSDEIIAGDYYVTSTIVDSSTGEDVTDHELMGNDVTITTKVKQSGKEKEYKNGAKITLSPDEKTEIVVEGTYLKEYKISSKGDPGLAWLGKIKVVEPTVDFKLKAKVLQSQSWYTLSDRENWKPVKVTLSVDGQPLTDDQLKQLKLTVKVSADTDDEGKLKYRYEIIPGESAYNIYVAQDNSGKYVEPPTGEYKLTISTTFIDENGKENPASDEVEFDVEAYSKWVLIIAWILGILILILLWLAFMLKKVMPKKLEKDKGTFVTISAGSFGIDSIDFKYNRKSKRMSISSPTTVDFEDQCWVNFNLRAVDNRFTGARSRRVAITSIDSNCDEIKIQGTAYVNNEGRWVPKTQVRTAGDGKNSVVIDKELSCASNFELRKGGGSATLSLRFKTVK